MQDLFGAPGQRVVMGPQAVILPGFAIPWMDRLLAALEHVQAQAPFRRMSTPGGRRMSVSTTSCGELGWVSNELGYRYSAVDPESGRPWPALPECLLELTQAAASEAGFVHFLPDTCLINRYLPGARMGLHQDRNERDFNAPIVSISLGMPATFLFGGFNRSDRPARATLQHGDVAVWGGVDRLRYHGVLPLADIPHPQLGSQRINLTLRRAG